MFPTSWAEFHRRLILNFIEKDRWHYLVQGVLSTLRITFFACLLGIAIGVVVAIIRASHDKNAATMRRGMPRIFLKIVNGICKVYLTVIRGTPVVVQLFIMVLVIFSSQDKTFTAILAFGINSGAYVAEIIRSGIMSIDKGQFEAGRSLGFNYIQTMRYIILPQAFKNVLPALANEFIVLLKETSVAGYVGVEDLTRGGQKILGTTFDPLFVYIAIAGIYLTLVMFFTWLVGKLERRLQSSDH
ncbi:MAG: amino acid transporter permease [Firmicutes bacterium]|nr:amino acid transporter permease [Bacillota bacterium]